MATINDQAVLQTIFHPNVPFDEDWQEEQAKQQLIQGDDSLSGRGRGRWFFINSRKQGDAFDLWAHNRFFNLFLTNHFKVRHLKGMVGWRDFAHRSPKLGLGEGWQAVFRPLATFVHASKSSKAIRLNA